MGPFLGSPSILGIAELIVPTGSFFHAQTHVSFHINSRAFPKCEDEPHLCEQKQSCAQHEMRDALGRQAEAFTESNSVHDEFDKRNSTEHKARLGGAG